jgi:glyoxylase-like metal-dependent hydrolase (beta-lactamase superfamily II)
MERRSSETRAESVVRGAVEADPDDEYLVGLAGTLEGGDSYFLSVGIGVRDLRRIIFTHQDLDHVGSGAALVR